ncbi:MAG: hypothetical protein NVS1B12_00630 [Acidimicrobiales bacterium]
MPASIVAVVIAIAVAGCTGSGKARPPGPTTPTTTINVLPAADRIRLGQARLGGPATCIDDAFCAAGVTRVYGLSLGSHVVALDSPTAIVAALQAGAVDIGVLPATSAAVGDPKLSVLVDDRNLVPAANLVPIADAALVRAAGPLLAATFDEISSELTPAGLTQIDAARAGGASPEAAAEGWLAAHVAAAVPDHAPPEAPTVVIGARSDDASAAIAALYSGALNRYGWRASVAPINGARAEQLDALTSGRVGVIIDQVSPLLEHLTGFSGTSSADVDQTMAALRHQLADRDLVAFAPSPARPGFVFALSRAVAFALNVSTLSEVARAAGARIPAGPAPTTTTVASSSLPVDAEGPPLPHAPALGVGSAGAAVTAVQSRLATLGYDRSSPTGLFGESTRRAVMAFQIDQGIIATGEVDVPTQRALLAGHPVPRPAPAPAPGDPGSVRVPLSSSGPRPAPAGTVYLAFGSGPSPVTAQLVGLLRAHQATATFFVDANALARQPDAVRAVASAGHAIGISEPPHDATTPIGADTLLRTAARAQEALAPLVGRTPTCLLAPYGATDPDSRQRAQQAGLKTVLWDLDPQDWRKPGTDAIVADVTAAVHAGSVVLLHDGGGDRAQTVLAVAKLLDALSAQGYGFAAIPDC